MVKKYADRIKHVHLKDIRKDMVEKVKKEELSFLDGVRMGTFTVPGDGDIDFQSSGRIRIYRIHGSRGRTGSGKSQSTGICTESKKVHF